MVIFVVACLKEMKKFRKTTCSFTTTKFDSVTVIKCQGELVYSILTEHCICQCGSLYVEASLFNPINKSILSTACSLVHFSDVDCRLGPGQTLHQHIAIRAMGWLDIVVDSEMDPDQLE